FPADNDMRPCWAYTTLAGLALKYYQPHLGRDAASKSNPSPPAWSRWNLPHTSQAPSDHWTRISSTPLMQKQVSLVWLLNHGAIMTRTRLSHMSTDISPYCTICTATPEDLSHAFWTCRRVQLLWSKIANFLTYLTTSNTRITLNLADIITGIPRRHNDIPNIRAIHGLATWEIYRARVELSLDNIHNSGDAMFLRWRATLHSRIVQDLRYAYKVTRDPAVFHRRWLCVPNRWFHFDPGERPLSGTLTFNMDPQLIDGRTRQ
ncbi:hypothetical protein GGI05_001730, partial [Coemansia sp. RSA 2603]